MKKEVFILFVLMALVWGGVAYSDRVDVTDSTVKQDLTDSNNNFIEIYNQVGALQTESSDYETRISDAEDTIAAGVVAGSGVLISSDDTTIGYIDGKLILDDGSVLQKTIINSGGDEQYQITFNPDYIIGDGASTLEVNMNNPGGDGGSQYVSLALVPKTEAHTSDYTIPLAKMNGMFTFTNTDSSEEVIYTIDADSTTDSLPLRFVVTENEYLRVKISNDSSDTLRFLSSLASDDGSDYMRSNTVGNFMEMRLVDDGSMWDITNIGGEWLYNDGNDE